MSLSGFSILLFIGSKLGEAAIKDPDIVGKTAGKFNKPLVQQEEVLDNGPSDEFPQLTINNNKLPPVPGLPPLIDEGGDDLPLPPLIEDAEELPPLLIPGTEQNEGIPPIMPPALEGEDELPLPEPAEEPEEVDEYIPMPPLEDMAEEMEAVSPVGDGPVDEVIESPELSGPGLMLPALPGLRPDEEVVMEEEVPTPQETTVEEYQIPEPVSEEEILLRLEMEEKERAVSEQKEQGLTKVQPDEDVIGVKEASEEKELDTNLDNEIELIDDGESLFTGLTDEMAEDPTQKLIEEIEKKEKEEEKKKEAEIVEEPKEEPKKVEPYQTPYDPSKETVRQNYKNQQLPEPVHAKNYNKENMHLPKSVYNEDHYKMFFNAAQNGDLKALHALKPLITEINRKDIYGNTALIKAVLSGQIQSIRFLLANNANPDIQNNDGVAALHIAASMDRPDIIEALKAKSANLYKKDKHGREPYIYAMERGYWGVLGQLVDGEFNPDEKLSNGEYKLINAIKLGKPKYVAFLMERGADPDIRDSQYYTPLMLAAYNGQAMIVEVLLKHNANIYARDGYNRDAAMLAEIGGHIGIAQRIATQKVRDTLQ